MWRIYSVDNVLFLLHRITGVSLFVYVIAHIWMVSTAMLGGPEMFDAIMKTLAGPEFLAGDILLFGGLVFHTINGLRLMAHERGLWLENADVLARTTIVAWLGLWGVAGAVAAVA